MAMKGTNGARSGIIDYYTLFQNATQARAIYILFSLLKKL
jgi:hypothetical protein